MRALGIALLIVAPMLGAQPTRSTERYDIVIHVVPNVAPGRALTAQRAAP